MTEYFDTASARLERLRKLEQIEYAVKSVVLENLRALDLDVVSDVSIASEFPGFPADLREKLHRSVLQYSEAALPVSVPERHFDTLSDHVESIGMLLVELHEIFHEVAERHVVGFSDDPRTPLRVIYARAEEYRETLARSLEEDP